MVRKLRVRFLRAIHQVMKRGDRRDTILEGELTPPGKSEREPGKPSLKAKRQQNMRYSSPDKRAVRRAAKSQPFALSEVATFANLLLERSRTLGLGGTDLARATVVSVHLKLLKTATRLRMSVHRVYVQLSSAYPLQALFRLCPWRLMNLAPDSG